MGTWVSKPQPAPKDDFSFGKVHRILKRAEFARLKAKGTRKTSKHFVLLTLGNDLASKRIGVIVTKKIGKASVRNQWKRYLREFFRMNKRIFKEATDFVFIVKRGAKISDFHSLSGELKELVSNR